MWQAVVSEAEGRNTDGVTRREEEKEKEEEGRKAEGSSKREPTPRTVVEKNMLSSRRPAVAQWWFRTSVMFVVLLVHRIYNSVVSTLALALEKPTTTERQ